MLRKSVFPLMNLLLGITLAACSNAASAPLPDGTAVALTQSQSVKATVDAVFAAQATAEPVAQTTPGGSPAQAATPPAPGATPAPMATPVAAATQAAGQNGQGDACHPDLTQVATALNVTVDQLQTAIGKPDQGQQPDLTAAAGKLGVSADTLRQAMQQALPATCPTPLANQGGKQAGGGGGQGGAVSPTPAGKQAGGGGGQGTAGTPGSFTMAQTLSDGAQGMTIAFDGLSFLTGNLGADSFFPPGKVADFWGFQYLRDNDLTAMGHNTDFLTKASLNMFTILTADQKAQLVTLAKSQVAANNDYGMKRFVLMTAFRRLLAGDLPAGTTGLSEDAVKAYSAELYKLDGQISFDRAQVMGSILYNLNDQQKAYLAGMVGKGMTSWPTVDEPQELRPLTEDEKIAVMTYSGDLFAWYAGSLDADVYFCPERQGTYFGSFYMKDAPAVGNPGYSIGTELTADMGNAFVAALNPEQAKLITSLVATEQPYLAGIVDVRTQVATQLRKNLAGQTADSATVLGLMEQYGALDGSIVYNFATNFAKVGQTLTDAQKAKLMDLRHQTLGDFTPKGAFLYAVPIAIPQVQNTDFLFK